MPRPRRPSRPDISAATRRMVMYRDNFTCRWCGWRPTKIPEPYDGRNAIGQVVETLRSRGQGVDRVWRELQLDHVHPVIRGGDIRDPANLQALCNTCNYRKGAKV